jgi:hypothetical protein
LNNSAPDSEERPESDPPSVSGNIAGIEKTFLRLTFWQTVLSVAGVFTGAVALYAALSESQAVRQQTAASVWPYVQFMINDTSDGDSASFGLSLDNVGVGPARMQSMLLTLHGEAVPDWQTAVDQLLPGKTLGTHYGKSSVSRRVLAPGQSVVAFNTVHTELALKMQEAVYNGAARLSYCYCSIFDECWSAYSSRPAGEEPIEPVAQCPDHGDRGFLD